MTKERSYLTTEEQKVLQFIIIGRDSLEKLKETFKDGEINLLNIINTLEKKGMIKVSYREGKIYGLIETNEGYKEVEKAGFEDWNVGNN